MVEIILDKSSVNELLNSYPIMTCWSVGIYYGSILHFEMNEQLIEVDKKGRELLRGSSTLSLDSDNWIINEYGQKVTTSDKVSPDLVEEILLEKFIGKKLEELIVNEAKNHLMIRYSGGIEIEVNSEDDVDDLMTLILPDGRFCCFNEEKGLFLPQEVDDFIAQHWERKGAPAGRGL